MSVLIGINDCIDCNVYHEKHPEHRFVKIEKNKRGNRDTIEIKKALKKLGHDKKFPVLLSDKFDKITLRKQLVLELKKEQ